MRKFIGFVCLVLVCVGGKSCMAGGSSNQADNSDSSEVTKSKKAGLKIYDTEVTSEVVKQAETSDDCDIAIKGTTDAPDGSIVYAQESKNNGDYNLASGNDEGGTDNKVKDHHFSFLVSASGLFDLDNLDDDLKVGQGVDLKIFCTNEKFDGDGLDDSGFVSKKVRRKLSSSDIEPYRVEVTKKMIHVFYSD